MSAGPVLHKRAAVLTRVWRISSRSKSERLIASSTSDVAACCSRASFNSLPSPEPDERLNWMVVGAMLRLDLPGLRPFRGLRVFATDFLPLVLDDRATSAPKCQQGHLIGQNRHSGRAE